MKALKKERKQKKKRLKILLVFEVLFILILIPVVFLVFQVSRIPSYNMELEAVSMNDVDDKNMSNYQNIAVFGVDSRANDLKKNTRSDSIIVVSINKKNKDVKLLSVYRDTYVNIEEHGYTKINHAYSYGGPELAISTLNKNFDLNIKDFITVNFSALTNLIDKAGGVTIDITEAELKHVNAYTRDVARINGTKCIYLKKAGKQKLNGTQATAYCRVRYTKGGDFTRAQRQRTVMYALLKELKSSGIPTMYSAFQEMLPQIYTSLSTPELLSIASGVFSYDIVEDTGFPFDSAPQKISGADVIVPKTLSSNVTKMHEFLFKTEAFKPSGTVAAYSKEIAAR